jgi:hypothetical protein
MISFLLVYLSFCIHRFINHGFIVMVWLEGIVMDAENDEKSKISSAACIFTEQFLTFLSAVRIAIDNDTYVKAKVVVAFSDLQQFIRDKDLSPGQIVSLLSMCIMSMMQEKSPVGFSDEVEAFY